MNCGSDLARFFNGVIFVGTDELEIWDCEEDNCAMDKQKMFVGCCYVANMKFQTCPSGSGGVGKR